MGTIDQKLNKYIWNNLSELKPMFSDKVYKSLLQKKAKKDREGFTDTLELIIDLDSDFFNSVNREYQKNLSIEEVNKELKILATDEVIERAKYWLENYPKKDAKYALLLNNLAYLHKSKNEIEEAQKFATQALEIYQEIVKLNPKDDAYINMGKSYNYKGEYDKALEYFQKAIELNPKNDDAYSGMGVSYYQQKEYDIAIESYQKAIELNPKNDNGYLIIGGSYYNKEEYDRALEYFQKAIELSPKNDNAYGAMGVYYNNKGEYDKAIEYFQKAIELNPKSYSTYYNIGFAYNNKEEYDSALEYFQKTIELNPKNDSAYIGMGASYHDKGEYDKALESYQKAIKLNPKNDNAYYNMGNSYSKKEEYDNALESYQKVIELNPKHDDAYNDVGVFYYNKREYDRAIESYQKAIKLNPKNNVAFNNLDIAMTKLNKAYFLNRDFSNLEFRIDGLKITNFKQYKSTFKIGFSEQVNIIIGQNAVGKTSLLQAITLGLLKQNSLDAPVKKYEEYISKEENEAELIIYHNNTEKKVEILRDKREIKENFFIPFILAYGSNFFTSKTNEVKEVAQGIINHTIHKNFTSSIFMDYTSGFVNPIRLLEFLDLEKDDNIPKIQQDFIDTINSFLEGFELKTEDKNYFFQKEAYEDRLGLEDLSEGYRGNVLIITDILIKIFGVGKTKDSIEGIILIDEFDKHLHPKWQSKLVNQLTKTFPKIQFIMTTHNPMSILDRNSDEITKLIETKDGIKAIRGKGTKSIDVSIVLLEYFGVESTVSETMQKQISDFNRLKLKKELTRKEQEELKELEQYLGNTVASNLIYNRPYLKFLEFIRDHKEINFDRYDKMNDEERDKLLEEFGDLFND